MHSTPNLILVAAPNFGQLSEQPWQLGIQHGVTLQRIILAGHSETEIIEQLVRYPEAVGIIVGTEPITARILAALPQLRVIGKHGSGVDNIDTTAAEHRGIEVVTAAGINAPAVAELTMGFLLAGVRQLMRLDAEMHAGFWQLHPGGGLAGKTLGIVGFGNIGQQVTKRALAFDMRIIATKPQALTLREALEQYPNVEFVTELDQLLGEADVVSVHIPAVSDRYPKFDAQQFAKFKAGAGFINTARGSLVDESALQKALRSGQLSFAALDTYTVEPLPVNSPLRSISNLILAPHIGGYTDNANEEMGMHLVRMLSQLLENTTHSS